MDVAITAGAIQAFMNEALALCDNADTAVILVPYYSSHLLSLQLCQAKVHIAPFDTKTLCLNGALKSYFQSNRPKLVVLTNPSNPFGLEWKEGILPASSAYTEQSTPTSWSTRPTTFPAATTRLYTCSRCPRSLVCLAGGWVCPMSAAAHGAYEEDPGHHLHTCHGLEPEASGGLHVHL